MGLMKVRFINKSAAPWPARGVWWWATLLTVALSFNLRSITAAGESLVPVLLIFLACAWWYRQSKRWCRRGPRSRILGYIIFGIGTYCLVAAGISAMVFVPFIVSMVAAADRIQALVLPLTIILLSLALSSGAIVLSHFCVFDPKRPG